MQAALGSTWGSLGIPWVIDEKALTYAEAFGPNTRVTY